jgi:hypothetical protein
MRFSLILGFGLSVLSMQASAICLFEPLEDQLRSADVIYVGTVVESKLVAPLDTLRTARSPFGKMALVQNTVVPELVFRGDPSQASTVTSRYLYSDPKGPFLQFGELVPVSPGETLLVVARLGETPSVSLCSASRAWDLETSKLVTKVLGPAP